MTLAEIQLRIGTGKHSMVATELSGDESVCRWKRRGVTMDWMWPGERENQDGVRVPGLGCYMGEGTCAEEGPGRGVRG